MARNQGTQQTALAPGITYSFEGDTLVLRMDTTQDLGPSSSGKTRLVASTRSFLGLPNGQSISLNLTRPNTGE